MVDECDNEQQLDVRKISLFHVNENLDIVSASVIAYPWKHGTCLPIRRLLVRFPKGMGIFFGSTITRVNPA